MATLPLPDTNSLLNISNQLGQTDISKSASSMSTTTTPSVIPNTATTTIPSTVPNVDTKTYVPPASELTNTGTVIIPEKKSNINYSSSSAGQTALVNNLEQNNNKTDTTTKSKTPEELYAESIAGMGTPESLASLRANMEQQQGIAEKKKVASDLAAKINAIDAEAEVAKSTLESSSAGKDVTSTFLGKQQQEIDRQLSIKKAPLTAQYQVAVGDLQGAQETVNQLVSDTVADRKANTEYKLQQYELAYKTASAAEKRILEAKAEETRIAERDADKLDSFKNAAIGVMKDANDYSKLSEIMSATTKEDVARLAEGITLQKTSGSGSTPITGEYSDIVNTILGSGNFTAINSERLINAVNAGQNPLPIIKNQAKNIMGQTQATALTKTEIAVNSMKTIQERLDDYYANGGKTNLFKGTFENVIQKFGEVTDPKLREIAQSIKKSLQTYRNNISGTAYSVQEGKEIETVFPGINKSPELNKATINGVIDSMNTDINTQYDLALGTDGTYQKLIESTSPSADTGDKTPSGLDYKVSTTPVKTGFSGSTPSGVGYKVLE